MYKLLAIDGGTVRGIVSAMVLAEIERCADKPIAELFDLVAGTSSGGILALGLTAPDASGKPAHSAAELAEVLEKEAPRIFPRATFPLFRCIKSWIRPVYSGAGLEAVLAEQFGETTLRDALTGVLVVSYATEKPDRRKPGSKEPKPGPGAHFSSREKAIADPRKNFRMRDAARGTSAGPTFFPPKRLELAGDPSKWYTLIDGGVVANNPAMCAYAAARKAGHAHGDILLVSVGAGSHLHEHSYRRARRWGRLQWVRPILDVLVGGVVKTTDFHLEQVLKSDRYYRFQASLHRSGPVHPPELPSPEFDDARPENIEELKRFAREQIIQPKRQEIEQLCQTLTG